MITSFYYTTAFHINLFISLIELEHPLNTSNKKKQTLQNVSMQNHKVIKFLKSSGTIIPLTCLLYQFSNGI